MTETPAPDAAVQIELDTVAAGLATAETARRLAKEVERLREVADAARLVVYEDAPGHLAQLVKAVWRLDGRKSPLLGDAEPSAESASGGEA